MSTTPTEKTKKPESVFAKYEFSARMLECPYENKPKKALWDPDYKLVEESYKKIIELWNKDQKSRNFIKHLIAAFLPYEPMNRMSNVADKDRIVCAILNRKLTGIANVARDYGDVSVQHLFKTAHQYLANADDLSVAGMEKDLNAGKEISEIDIKIAGLMEKMPEEVKNIQIGVMSDSSDKFMMVESIMALLGFAQGLILAGNKELNFLLKKIQLKRIQENLEEKLTDSEVNKVVAAQTFGLKNHIKEDTISKLEKMKAEMDAKNGITSVSEEKPVEDELPEHQG